MNEAPKKRLQLMPEVLPAPTRATTTSDVRGRTLTHMKRLLATAAALPLASCTKTDAPTMQKDTIPSASVKTTESASAQDTVERSLSPPPSAPTATASAAPTPSAVPTVTAPHTGYAVVDPMPAPARCMGLATATSATAVFKKDAGGIYLELTASLPTTAAWSGTTFTAGQTPNAWSGTVVSSTVTATKATVNVRPGAGSQDIGVHLQISCPAGPGSISLTASFAASPSETTKPTLAKHDY
jgi:hypothetical protein